MELALHLLEREFRVSVQDTVAKELLLRNFSQLLGPPSRNAPVLYRVGYQEGRFQLTAKNQAMVTAADPGEFLYLFEHQLVIDLQESRSDLLFIHAAVLSAGGRAVVLVAPSGTGKSTMALAMVERGFGYLSDELAPVHVADGWVSPYAHALCLKQVPPGRDDYPPHGFSTNRSWHLPAEYLGSQSTGAPLGWLLFLERGEEARPIIKDISRAEATVRLLTQVLNSLAHPSFGIDAAMAVVRRCRSLTVQLGSVDETANLITTLFESKSQEQVIGRHDRQAFPNPSSCGG